MDKDCSHDQVLHIHGPDGLMRLCMECQSEIQAEQGDVWIESVSHADEVLTRKMNTHRAGCHFTGNVLKRRKREQTSSLRKVTKPILKNSTKRIREVDMPADADLARQLRRLLKEGLAGDEVDFDLCEDSREGGRTLLQLSITWLKSKRTNPELSE